MAFHVSLRTKSLVAVGVLIAYLALIAVLVAKERTGLMGIALEMNACQYAVSLLEPMENALAHSLVEGQHVLNGAAERNSVRPVALEVAGTHLQRLNVALGDVALRFPALREDIERFRGAVGAMKAMPTIHNLERVRDAEQELLSRLHGVVLTYQRRSNDLAARFHDKQQFIGAFAVGANVIGAVGAIVVILVFFTTLARDIKRLEARAAAIVQGYDGEPLANRRSDEVGSLIGAVNRMQVDLRRTERQAEVARQQRFHQEKMAAVGSVASAIGHEVANPIAAIAGVAQFIAGQSADDTRPEGRKIHEFARQIIAQAERIARIMRQLAALAAPGSPEPELLDLNALARSTCAFIRYDKRFRAIEFEEALDPNLPAVTCVCDHLTQIVMNLLLNSADALEGIADPARLRIRIATRTSGDAVQLSVTDHGRGMTPDVLAHAFDESFTTKPAARGRGIGLFVCKSLIEKCGGHIDLVSVLDEGTTATVHIPLRHAHA